MAVATLISIADWDLRWQHVYRYETPCLCPKAQPSPCHFDPTIRGTPATLRSRRCACLGAAIKEEMGDFWLQVIAKDPRDRDMLDQTFRANWMATMRSASRR